MGCGIRDNTREEKIYFGRKLDRGEMEGGLWI
jgi:hypothetical protein